MRGCFVLIDRGYQNIDAIINAMEAQIIRIDGCCMR
jgi:hypothetical protein